MSPRGGGMRAVAALCAALAAAVLLAFSPVLDNGFLAYDDQAIFLESREVRDGITPQGVKWAFASFVLGNWIPVTLLGHMLTVELFGLAPRVHHMMSVLWHALASLLLLLALRRLTGDLWRSALVAALFALHPLRVESVAWAAELKDPLSGCWFAATLLAYARYAARQSFATYAAVVVAFSLGLMSKPTLVPLPLLLLMLDWWPLGRWRPPAPLPARLFFEKVPLLALAAGVGALTVAAQRSAGALGTAAVFPLPERIGNALVALPTYLGKMLWPSRLAVLYPHPEGGLPPWQPLLAALALLGVTALALLRTERRPFLALGWFWFLGMLAPVSGIVQIGLQGLADRYTYLPLTGVGIALAWSTRGLLPRRPQAAAALCVLPALAAATSLQTHFWRDTVTLWEHAITATARNWVALGNLADARAAAGQHQEAIAHLNAALAVRPGHGPAHYALGYSLAMQGQLPAALASLRRAVQLAPETPEFHLRLGTALAHAGQLPEAIAEFRAALRLRPGYEEARQNLERALALREPHLPAGSPVP